MRSEEDIRTHVVARWLSEHGFSANEIKVERSFELRLGRNVYRVGSDQPLNVARPRTDLLVRSVDGRNLIIIEVKAESESLTERDREQAISYARLLREGGIAPFSVLTNGRQTEIYDSITRERIDGETVPLNHRYARAGFRITGEDIESTRAEALERFVSLSPTNLLAFCRSQVGSQMRLLRSDNLYSGKKYIPALYVRRREPEKQLRKMLTEERRRLVLVTGEPQQGKTNFVCNAVEECLARGEPCLFHTLLG